MKVILHNSFIECFRIPPRNYGDKIKKYSSKKKMEVFLNREYVMRKYREAGFYAFADRAFKTIHLWFDKEKITFEILIRILGHELGHIIDELPLADKKMEEEKAWNYSYVAILSYNKAKELYYG